jgi:hypothetical protein
LSSTDASQATATPDSKPYNPYLAARREWDERYGDLITRARNWRLLALTSSLASDLKCLSDGPLGAQRLRRVDRRVAACGDEAGQER